MFFYWDDYNVEHIAEHGIEPDDAEFVVRRASRPYPRRTSGVKWLVRGRTRDGRMIQVIYVVRQIDEIDERNLSLEERVAVEQDESAIYVIHARPLRRGER
ncbi:MAG TPA: hypothetical protein VFE47_18965 [Tepidisphaeraceae bacterium]|jgi:uncharacterized DUF497 family protein|nr:hypothetical protein [Tepidisphaeraceae bacterium]